MKRSVSEFALRKRRIVVIIYKILLHSLPKGVPEMTVDQLACFLAVVEYGNFTVAAEKLYISHSAVSKAISSLEQSLGVKLLNRDNRSVTLTAAGEFLKERGGRLFELWRDLENRVGQIDNEFFGSISLACPYIDISMIFPLCHEMSRRCPRVVQDISTNQIPVSILRSVLNGHVDFGITFSFIIPPETDELGCIVLQKDSFYGVMSTEHPLASRSWVTLDELMQQQMVFPSVSAGVKEASLLRTISRPIQEDDYQAESVEECLMQVSLDRGVTILPGILAKDPKLPYIAVPISDVPEGFAEVLIWRHDRVNSSMRNFIKIAEELFSGEGTY